MSTRVRRCLAFIDLVLNSSKVSPLLSRSLLVEAKAEQVLCIIELVVNTLQGNLDISTEARDSLFKSRVILRQLSLLEEPETAREALRRHFRTVLTFLRLCRPFLQRSLGDNQREASKRNVREEEDEEEEVEEVEEEEGESEEEEEEEEAEVTEEVEEVEEVEEG